MTVKDADVLLDKYAQLRDKYKKTKDPKVLIQLKKQEDLCLRKFKYLVDMKTNRYKNFNNHDDLIQEGMEALLKAMNSYKPGKSNCFWWLHHYINTKIARSANLHTTIRYPLKYAKKFTPHRESSLPIIYDRINDPETMMEQRDILRYVGANFKQLNETQTKVAKLYFGIDGSSPASVSGVCQQLGISRPACVKILDQVLGILKKNIQT